MLGFPFGGEGGIVMVSRCREIPSSFALLRTAV